MNNGYIIMDKGVRSSLRLNGCDTGRLRRHLGVTSFRSTIARKDHVYPSTTCRLVVAWSLRT